MRRSLLSSTGKSSRMVSSTAPRVKSTNSSTGVNAARMVVFRSCARKRKPANLMADTMFSTELRSPRMTGTIVTNTTCSVWSSALVKRSAFTLNGTEDWFAFRTTLMNSAVAFLTPVAKTLTLSSTRVRTRFAVCAIETIASDVASLAPRRASSMASSISFETALALLEILFAVFEIRLGSGAGHSLWSLLAVWEVELALATPAEIGTGTLGCAILVDPWAEATTSSGSTATPSEFPV
mmetsp:Transcript_91496/g.259100  ORF Transcript_91496/g.259100 Transcript_91496/m.259100 type:complete len:238 (+) Transcript_91496:430-1143(+)